MASETSTVTPESTQLSSAMKDYVEYMMSEPTLGALAEVDKIDPFEVQRIIEAQLAGIAGSMVDDKGYLTKEYMQVRRNFLIGVFDYFVQLQKSITDANKEKAATDKADRVSNFLFSGSPNFTDYIGGWSDVMDMMVVADKATLFTRPQWELTEGLMQSITFSYDPEDTNRILVEKIVEDTSPASQLEKMRLYLRLMTHSKNASYGDAAMRYLSTAIAAIEANEAQPALTRIVAGSIYGTFIGEEGVGNIGDVTLLNERYALDPKVKRPNSLGDRYTATKLAAGYVGFRNSYGGIDYVAEAEVPGIHDISDEDFTLGRISELLGKFPTQDVLNKSCDWLRQIGSSDIADNLLGLAPNEARTYVHKLIDARIVADVTDSIQAYDSEALGLSHEDLALLDQVHHPVVLKILKDSMGVDIQDLSLMVQARFLSFVSNKGMDDYRRLSAALMGNPSNTELLEAFLAIEYGDDFGDVLLDIFEAVKPEEALELTRLYRDLGCKAHEYAELFSQESLEFRNSVERAMNERITDILYATKELALNGRIYHEEFGKSVEICSIKEMIHVYMTVLSESIDRIVHLMRDGHATRVVQGAKGFDKYRFQSEDSSMILYVREQGSYGFDPSHEYGSQAGVEASISMIISPYESHTSSQKKGNYGELSIRLDREGRTYDKHVATKERDPVQEEGTISLDIGSVLGDPNSFGTKIGLLISAGNALRSEKVGTKKSLNHNSDPFNQEKYGSASGFAGIAKRMNRMARVRVASSSKAINNYLRSVHKA